MMYDLIRKVRSYLNRAKRAAFLPFQADNRKGFVFVTPWFSSEQFKAPPEYQKLYEEAKQKWQETFGPEKEEVTVYFNPDEDFDWQNPPYYIPYRASLVFKAPDLTPRKFVDRALLATAIYNPDFLDFLTKVFDRKGKLRPTERFFQLVIEAKKKKKPIKVTADDMVVLDSLIALHETRPELKISEKIKEYRSFSQKMKPLVKNMSEILPERIKRDITTISPEEERVISEFVVSYYPQLSEILKKEDEDGGKKV